MRRSQWRCTSSALAALCCAALLAGCGGDSDLAGSEDSSRGLTIEIDWPGASAEEVEDQLAAPVEHKLMSLVGVASIDSVSRAGRCVVNVEFLPEADDEQSRRRVTDALDRLGEMFPDGVQPPAFSSVASDVLPGIWLVLSSEGLTAAEMSVVAADVEARLERIAGVDEVQLFGARRPQIDVRFDAHRLAAHELTAAECMAAAQAEARRKPARTIRDLADRIEQCTVAMRDEVPVRMSDIALVRIAAARPGSLAECDGSPCIAIGVFPRPKSAGEVERQVREQYGEPSEWLPPGVALEIEVFGNAGAGLYVEAFPPPGVSVERMSETMHRAGRELDAVTGGDHLTVWSESTNAIRLFARPSPADPDDLEQLLDRVRKMPLPGAMIRATKLSAGSATRRPDFGLKVVMSGPDLTLLVEWSHAVAQKLAGAKFANIVVEGTDLNSPRLSVELKRDRAAELGLTQKDVSEAVAMAGEGVMLPPAAGSNDRICFLMGDKSTVLQDVTISTGKRLVALTNVAEIRLTTEPGELYRRNGRRIVRLTALPAADSGNAKDLILEQARKIAKQLKLSEQYTVEIE